jgi:hypothetical protein
MLISKDPTELFQKQIQQTIHKCNAIIDKKTTKILTTNETHGTKT